VGGCCSITSVYIYTAILIALGTILHCLQVLDISRLTYLGGMGKGRGEAGKGVWVGSEWGGELEPGRVA
jgi:hypothetical protein